MTALPNPYVILAALFLLLAAGVQGYRVGYRHAEAAAAADKAAALTRAIAQADAIAAQDAEVLGAHEQDNARIRTVFRTIREGVVRYVETHAAESGECLDADGLRLWADANAGRIAAQPAGKLDYSLRGSTPATLGARGGPAGQPRTGGGAVPRMPGTAESAGGVGQ